MGQQLGELFIEPSLFNIQISNLNKIENENKLNIISQINNEHNEFNKNEGNNKDKKSNSYFNYKRNLNSKEGSYHFFIYYKNI